MNPFSLQYIYLLTLVTFTLCFFVKLPLRWIILATANLLFFCFINFQVAPLFIALSVFNYFSIKWASNIKVLDKILIVCNLLFLAYYKYLIPLSTQTKVIILPIGISIFIFQQITFLANARGRDLGKIKFSEFLSYSFFFGNISTGPIGDFESLFACKNSQLIFSRQGLYEGITLTLLGAFKIFCVSGNLSPIVTSMFHSSPENHTDFFIPFILNKYEIYANFSGYTDFATAIGLFLGMRLPKNFNRPFATSSISEFWKRWHMSLTAWIRKYVFFPLITSPFSQFGVYPIMLITFTIFALWHGPKATFLAYGFTQATLIFLAEKFDLFSSIKVKSKSFKSLFSAFKWVWFYFVLISIPGILFRSNSITQFLQIMKILSESSYSGAWAFAQIYSKRLWMGSISIIILEILDRFSTQQLASIIRRLSYIQKILLVFLSLCLIFFLGIISQNSGFVYSIF